MTLICKKPKTNGRIYHAVKQFYQKNYIPLQKKTPILEYWVHSYNRNLNFSNYKTMLWSLISFFHSTVNFCQVHLKKTVSDVLMFKYQGLSVINYVCRLPQMTKHITRVSWNEIVTKVTKGIKTSSKSPRGSCFGEHFHFEFLSAFPLPLAGAVVPSQKPGLKKKDIRCLLCSFQSPFSLSLLFSVKK